MEDHWPFPIALYFDAMPYIKRDGVLAVVVVNILSGVRHLVGVLRKSTFCRCGCRGWCSIWPFLANLHSSLSALREGIFPSSGSPGMIWDQNSERAMLAGGLLTLTAFALQIKVDWGEVGSTLAFASWSHNSWPCAWCDCEKHSLHVRWLGDAWSFPLHSLLWRITMPRARVASELYL